MNIEDLLKLASLLDGKDSNACNKDQGLNSHVGEKVIIRTYAAGVWFGKLIEKSGTEVILKDARRLYYWKAKKSISLSGVAVHGLEDVSKVCHCY